MRPCPSYVFSNSSFTVHPFDLCGLKVIFWDVVTCSLVVIVPMMETISTSETSVSFYETTRLSIAEDGHLVCDISFYSNAYPIGI
jgi:hypothetical protein